ncbi:tRNA pseudouridine synthase B [Sanguibacter gelidistatuariae]|uniref:tRNA pseudouridine synthase B n=1 Tax=Sanguibacter gelidistatuariae TaxID=1814289 RepID=A0A1G6NN13_9MICO|nr:tRNA pseudouridine(55) synthase TruB [Sanguibacter gelidistatuariae]SDC69128.1 tRNA pseudouridine synthase B [Sanguibacter gelidistatuariae]
MTSSDPQGGAGSQDAAGRRIAAHPPGNRQRQTQGAARERRASAPDGFVVVDKPAGWTSHDVVARMRGLAATRKVGHAGTLDPMATGVLVIGVGRATRLLTYVVGEDKEYATTIRLGVGTTTDDAEGEATTTAGAGAVEQAALARGVASLTGDILQVPSSVSAIKVDGQRAYARVRAGQSVELAARPVTVSRFEVTAQRSAVVGGTVVLDVDATVVCTSGTYIRALARDLGDMLGTGGHLTMLRRTRVGGYHLDAAQSLESLQAQVTENGVIDVMALSDAARATFPVRDLSDAEVTALGYGKRLVPIGDARGMHAGISSSNELIALLEESEERSQPVVVFAPAV